MSGEVCVCVCVCVPCTIRVVTPETFCDLHVAAMSPWTVLCACVFWVCPVGVHLPCPLSLTNLAECNYSSMCLSGHGDPAPPPAIKTEEKQDTAIMGKKVTPNSAPRWVLYLLSTKQQRSTSLEAQGGILCSLGMARDSSSNLKRHAGTTKQLFRRW